MKTFPPALAPLPALAFLLALASAAARADDAPAPKTHALFMGADVSVGLGTHLYKVEDVVGLSWIVDVDGSPKEISTKKGPIVLKVVPSLKLTEAVANVSGLVDTPGFAPGSDPSETLSRALNEAALQNAGNQAAVNQAQGAVVFNQTLATQVNGTSTAAARSFLTANPNAIGVYQHAGNDSAAATNAQASLQTTMISAGADNEPTGDRGFAHGFDALEVSFTVSAAHPLTHPFVVTVTRFHEKGDRPGYSCNQVYARELGLIDAHANLVQFQEGGFPPGYVVESFELHLYNNGLEVATNVAPNFVALTRDEAFEYIKIEYLAAHKADTLPAKAVFGKLPADFAVFQAEGKYAPVYYVRVTKDGLPGDTFMDAACSQRLRDPYVESIVKAVRFKPALDKGTPVDSVAPLSLARLTNPT
jgi:hypothetical protein